MNVFKPPPSTSSALSRLDEFGQSLSSVVLGTAFLVIGAALLLVYAQIWSNTQTNDSLAPRSAMVRASLEPADMAPESMLVASGFNPDITLEQYQHNRRMARAMSNSEKLAAHDTGVFPVRGIDVADVDALLHPLTTYVDETQQMAIIDQLKQPVELVQGYAVSTAKMLRVDDTMSASENTANRHSTERMVEADTWLTDCLQDSSQSPDQVDWNSSVTPVCDQALARF